MLSLFVFLTNEKYLAYHLKHLRVPLVVRVPQVGNPWSRDYVAHLIDIFYAPQMNIWVISYIFIVASDELSAFQLLKCQKI